MLNTPVSPSLLLSLISLLFCFQCSGSSGPVTGEKVLEHASEMAAFGPHPAGSPAQEKVSGYIASQLSGFGLEVDVQTFETPSPIGRVTMRNIRAEIPGSRSEVMLLASHYDSKLFEHFEFVGANDGIASSALLLELARILARDNPVEETIWCVFFDGEEAFRTWTNVDSLYGSRYFVRDLKRKREIDRIRAMILLDLVGGAGLSLKKESNSSERLSDIIWSTARRMGHQSFFTEEGSVATEDDHIPFLREGVSAVNLIDLSYPYWHTAEDTLDKLSPENLEVVGNVVLESLPEISKAVRER